MQFCSKPKKSFFQQAIYLNLDHLSSHHLPRHKGNLINQKQKNTPSTTLDLLEEQIEMAQQVMNNKEKQIQQVPIQMHPIIRNPEAISDDEMPDPGVQVQIPQMQPAVQVQVPQMQPAAQVQVPQMQPAVQVQVPQMQPAVQVQVPQMQPVVQVQVPQMQPAAQVQVHQRQPQAQVICPQVQHFRITQPNPPILKFTTGLVICTCAGCQDPITHDQKTYPSNMVFMKKGMVAFYNLKCNRIQMKEQNIHFHLSMVCLQKDDKATEYRDLRTNDETFEQLTIEQMELLEKLDFLCFITVNKQVM